MVNLEDPAIHTHKYSQLTFDKNASAIQWSNNDHIQQFLMEKMEVHLKKILPKHRSIFHTNSRWITDLIVI